MGFWKSLAKAGQREFRKEFKRQMRNNQTRYTCDSCKRYTKGYGGKCSFCGERKLSLTKYRSKRLHNCLKCGLRKTSKTYCEGCRLHL